MNTKILMTISALFLGIIGLVLSFLPDEIINFLNIETNVISTLFLQILSALYLGFGILNWMAKGSLIGGIYNRPIAIGNLMHFAVGSIAFVKIISRIDAHTEIIIFLTVVYVIFAFSFAFVFRTNPNSIKT